MNTESKRLFHKPIMAAAVGWAVLIFSAGFIFAVRRFMPDFTLLFIFNIFLFVLFLLVWTAVACFGILQCSIDLKYYQSIQDQLSPTEKGKPILLCMAAISLNMLLIACNCLIIFRLCRLWLQLFP